MVDAMFVLVQIWNLYRHYKGLFIWGKLSQLARKHFDWPNILFCSYEETLSRLPGKVPGRDVALVRRARREKSKKHFKILYRFKNRKVADTTKSFPAKRESFGYAVFIWEKTLSRSPRSCLSTSEISVHGKTFRLITFPHMNRP
jgi:hypothetical protein